MVLEYFVGYKYIVLLRSQDLVSIGGCFRPSLGALRGSGSSSFATVFRHCADCAALWGEEAVKLKRGSSCYRNLQYYYSRWSRAEVKPPKRRLSL